ncbi:MAG: hypothetical protein AABO58_12975 [Acidobacteriota bacterium]
MNRINIFLVDDHTVVRQGLRLLIEAHADMHVVGEARGAAEAIARSGADVVVMDVSTSTDTSSRCCRPG